MKLGSKLLAMLLALAMLMSFAACNGGSDKENSKDKSAVSSEESSVEESSESDEERAARIYKAAKDAIDKKAELKQRVKAVTTRTIGTDSFTLETETDVIYQSKGSDKYTVYISEKNTAGKDSWSSEKYFIDGKYAYQKQDEDVYYYEETDAEKFEDVLVPLMALDAELYSSVTFAEGDESTLVFTEATAVEEWLAPEYAKVTETKGEMKLDEKGEPTQIKYSVSYEQGPASYKQDYTIDLGEAEEKTIALPEGEGVKVEHVALFDLFETAYLTTSSLTAFDFNDNMELYTQAAGYAYTRNEQVYTYGKDEKDFICKTNSSLEEYYSDGSSEAVSVEQNYKDGKLTTVIDGESGTQKSSMKDILDSVIEKIDALSVAKPDISLFEKVKIEDIGNYLYIVYTLNEDGGKGCEDYVSQFCFNDIEAIDSIASKYVTDTADGYISIDKDTMLITAMGFEYKGTHTIEGDEYENGALLTMGYNVASPSTYKEITGELPEEEKSEEEPTPVFYKVTAPNGKTMYLLGTIHIGDGATANLPKEIYDALEASDALAVELDIIELEEKLKTDPKIMQLAMTGYYYTDGSTIKDHIEDELYNTGLGFVFAGGHLTPDTADYFTPYGWSETINDMYTGSYLGLSTEYGVDKRLLRIAKEKEMEILSVEKYEDQLGMPAKFTEDIHRVLLMDALNGTRNDYIDGINEMYAMWCEGDEKALIEYIRDDGLTEEILAELTEAELEAIKAYDKMLEADRDAGMIEKAKEYMEGDKTVFFAVGLAHLLSETGLVDTLRADGYTVELVEYSK